jgi:hypothetical protein
LISHDASHLNQVCAVIPANSQIVDVILNVTTANDDTTASTVSVGTVADADAFINAQSVQALGPLPRSRFEIQKQLMLERVMLK